MMKKIFVIFIAVCITASCLINTAVFAQPSDAENQILETVGLLKSVGIIDDIDDKILDAEMTREEIAYYVARMNGLSPASDKRYFIDLSFDSYAYGYVNSLADAGIITLPEDKMYRPYDNASFNEALKMFVCSLGYGVYAEAKGGFPSGYAKTASELKLTSGVSGTNVTYRNCFRMIYNVLRADMYDIDSISADGASYSSGKMFIETVYDIVCSDGTVEALYGGTVSGDTVKSGSIIIDSQYYSVADDGEFSGFLGNYVTYYYKKVAGGRDNIIYISHSGYGKEDVNIDIEDVDQIEGDTVYYTLPSGKSQKISCPNARIVYNGRVLDSDIKKTVDGLNKGMITLKDADGDNRYDYIFIKDYRNFFVSSVNSGVMYNKLFQNDIIDIDAVDNLVISDGKDLLSGEDLIRDMSLSVAESADGKIVEIIVNTTFLSGKPQSIGDESVTLDGMEYKIDKSYRKTFLDSVNLNDEYNYIADRHGRICYMYKGNSRSMKLGYLIAVGSDGGMDAGTKFKILDEDSSVIKVESAKNLTIDKTKLKNADYSEIKTLLKRATGDIEQLIQFSQTSDGAVNEIDTLYVGEGEDPECSLRRVFETVETRWYHRGRYGFTAICSGTVTKTFCIPDTDTGDDNDYYTKKGVVVGGDGSNVATKLDAYYVGENSAYVDALISQSDIKSSKPKYAFMLDKTSRVMNKNGDTVVKVSGYTGGEYVSYELDQDTDSSALSGAHKGDLFIIYQNTVGKTNKIVRVFDGQADGDGTINWVDLPTRKLLQEGSTNKMGVDTVNAEELNLSFGYVFNNYDGVVAIKKDMASEIGERIIVNGKKCPMYDKASDTIEIVDYRSIVDYKTAGEACTRLIHHTWYDEDRNVYLYN